MLGMYVHTHWSYRRPYAARTWTLEDWKGYLRGLRRLGYDLVMLWPQCDCMPGEPTSSDLAFLKKAGEAIRFAQGELGMKFAIVAAANCIGNERSASYTLEERPYYICERRVNPKDRFEVRAFLAGRRRQIEPIAHADALVIIDSDPGGYAGSTSAEFVEMVRGQLEVFRQFNAKAEFYAWLWFGWENQCGFCEAVEKGADAMEWYRRDPTPAIREELRLLKGRIAEPWGLFACLPSALAPTAGPEFKPKRLHLPYGLLEAEPSFPLTNYFPTQIEEQLRSVGFSAEEFPRGAMANSQTHCLQLPNAYFFAHFARGGGRDSLDLARFAEDLLPGRGERLAHAWTLIESGTPAEQRAAAQELLKEAGRKGLQDGTGLLFGDPQRFLVDLAMNLQVRAGMQEFTGAVEKGQGVAQKLRALLNDLRPYQQRLGFTDAYYGPLAQGFNEPLRKLRDPAIDQVLRDFDDWRRPELRNTVAPRLIDAAQAWCLKQVG